MYQVRVIGRKGWTMARECMTDEEVESEIERLRKSHHVQLAKKEQAIRYRRRQYLYALRSLEKKGRALEESGITMEILEGLSADDEYDFCADA